MSTVATSDSQAIALLCAPIAIGDAKPLTPSEWAKLASAIHTSELGRPGALVGLMALDLAEQLGLDPELADRLASLLDRGGTLAFELERLESRGVWVAARSDDAYPELLKRRLGRHAPALLFGAGRREPVPERGVAVVGSRDATAEALDFAEELGRSVAREGVALISGGARGVDRTAMHAAMDAGGLAVGVVADSLVRFSQQPNVRAALSEELLTLLTPYAPESRFSVGNAMGRNRLIYCLSEAAVVVATSSGSGGTWAGATENLKAGWVSLWVWDSAVAPAGNRDLQELGAQPLAALSVEALLAPDGEQRDRRAEDTDPGTLVPALERYLATPRTEHDVRRAFALGQGEARRLLKLGVDSGRLLRDGTPFRYVTAEAVPQSRLFDAG